MLNDDSERTVAGWSDLSASIPRSEGWMHSGVAITDSGAIVCAHPDGYALLVVTPGKPATVVPIELTEPHGIALAEEEGVVAVADAGYKVVAIDDQRHYTEQFGRGRAALVGTADGRIRLELRQPEIPAYDEVGWRPTSIAVDRGAAGTGDIWVADGYGANLVHRFDRNGEHLATFDGSSTGQAFDCPHGIMLRRRGADLDVLVADRGHHRIVVLDVDGNEKRVFGRDNLDSPSSMTLLGDDIFITELFGGVAQFSADGEFVGRLEPRRVRSQSEPGWPNRLGPDGEALLPPDLTAATFNSPHGIASHDGALYMTEWLIGGRLVRIAPQHPSR